MIDDGTESNAQRIATSRPSRAAERVAHDLASFLLEARFPEGTDLAPEDQLIEVLECSRTSLRGALRLLESWGLVTVHRGRNGGIATRRPQASDLRPALAVLIHSRNASLADVMTARRAIEPLIASEAARKRTDQQVTALESTVADARQGVESRDLFAEANAEFHRGLADAAGLTVLGAFLLALTTIGDETVHRVAPTNQPRRLRILARHEQVVEAIAQADSHLAELAMLAYHSETEASWREFAPHLIDVPLRPLAFMDP